MAEDRKKTPRKARPSPRGDRAKPLADRSDEPWTVRILGEDDQPLGPLLVDALKAADEAKEEPGTVWTLENNEPAPRSSLVRAFEDADERPADAIVLRGYLGRSDFFKRTRDYLERAKNIEIAKARDTQADRNLEICDDEPQTARIGDVQSLIDHLDEVRGLADPHVPLRLYLTPSLDSYVDFHRSCVLALRREPRPERRDTFTVWLRVFDLGSQMPVPYRVVQETNIGPSFAAYLGGDLIDDYLGASGSSSSAWGDQSTVFGRKPGTGVQCAVFGRKPGTGVRCGE